MANQDAMLGVHAQRLPQQRELGAEPPAGQLGEDRGVTDTREDCQKSQDASADDCEVLRKWLQK